MQRLHSLSLTVWWLCCLLCSNLAQPPVVAVSAAASASASSYVFGFNAQQPQQQPNAAQNKRCTYNPQQLGFDFNTDNDGQAAAPDYDRMQPATAEKPQRLSPFAHIRNHVRDFRQNIANVTNFLTKTLTGRYGDMSKHDRHASHHDGRPALHHPNDRNQQPPQHDMFQPPPPHDMYPAHHRGRYPPPPPPHHERYPPQPHHGRYPPPPHHGRYPPPPHHGRYPPPPHHDGYASQYGGYPPSQYGFPPSQYGYPPSQYGMYPPSQHGMYPSFQDPPDLNQEPFVNCDDNDTPIDTSSTTVSSTTQKTTTTTAATTASTKPPTIISPTPPRIISPTPPSKSGSLIIGTNRPKLEPTSKSTTTQQPPRSNELSQLRNIIFPNVKQYAHLFIKDEPSANGIEPRR